MMPTPLSKLFAATALCSCALAPAYAQSSVEELRNEFAKPPAEARPWTWFHVMSGNMTREGITKDLEAIERVGIGGIVLFTVTQGISYGPVKFNSPEYHDLVAHVAAECQRLGLKFTFHNADGWSSSGGPWITPEQSMKRLVWSETIAKGGKVDMAISAPPTAEGFYQDVAVIAYPALKGELDDLNSNVRITSSDPGFDIAEVTDGNFLTSSALTSPSGQTEGGWVQFTYPHAVSIRHLQVANVPERDVAITLQVSDDGVAYRDVRTFGKTRILRDEWEVDAAFAPVSARHFRISFDQNTSMGEVGLSQVARIDNPAGYSALGYVSGDDLPPMAVPPVDAVIDPAEVINLSRHLQSDGSLKASLPDGEWTIMRFGYTSTGAQNVMPSHEGAGLEVDKFDEAAFQAHYDAFINPVITRARAVAPDALGGVMIDSYEVGGQNWTGGYERSFEQATGADLLPWLPIYAGRFVSGSAQSSAMFGRIRKFNARLINDNYYGKFASLMGQEGLESLIQPYGNGPFDELAVGSVASIPAGEFWVRRDDLSNLNGAVSSARIYGKKIAAAEAFTAVWDDNWKLSPAFAKKWGDRAWVAGVNQFFFHRFAHQANTHVAPGMTMNRWGSHFDRTQPWWESGGKAWFEYMARGQHLLRQGHAVADVAMAVGSNSPVICPAKSKMIEALPPGVEFDCVDTPTLLQRGRFENGTFVLPSGATYGMIWWPHDSVPNAEELARLEEARRAGVPVAMGHRGEDAKSVYAAAGLQPRLSADGQLPSFTQRRTGDTDIVFAFNDSDETRRYDLCFRVGGKAGEIWNPVTGSAQSLAGETDSSGCSRVALELAPFESRFLVFDDLLRFDAQQDDAEAGSHVIASLQNGWSVRFASDYGASEAVSNSSLFDWAKSDNPEIRYFSGTATYRNHFKVKRSTLREANAVMLDLGTVANVARVRVNGIEIGTVWTAPYHIDILPALKSGKNKIEIEVANLWVNRLIGDASLPDTSGYVPEDNFGYRAEDNLPERDMVEWYSANQPPPPGPRRTFATQYFQQANDPLIPSGLIGPVVVRSEGN